MVLDEDADALLRIRDAMQTLAQALDDDREGVLLDQVEQLFFGFEVVVKASERHAGGARQVAQARAFVSLLAKDVARVRENARKPAIEARVGRSSRCGGVGSWGE